MALLQLEPTGGSEQGVPAESRSMAATGNVQAAAAEASGSSPSLRAILVSMGSILLALVVCSLLNQVVDPPPFIVPAGVGLFAVFYAVTQAIERFLEPISALICGTKGLVSTRNGTLAAAISSGGGLDGHQAMRTAAAAQGN